MIDYTTVDLAGFGTHRHVDDYGEMAGRLASRKLPSKGGVFLAFDFDRSFLMNPESRPGYDQRRKGSLTRGLTLGLTPRHGQATTWGFESILEGCY